MFTNPFKVFGFLTIILLGAGCSSAETKPPELGQQGGAMVQPGRGQGMQRPRFEDADANKDGQISEEEFNQFRTRRIADRAAMGRRMRNAGQNSFQELDVNKDQKLTPDEFPPLMPRQWPGPAQPKGQ